jgi:hypothetical protein
MAELRVNTKGITLELKMPHAFGLRMWCGLQLIKLAAFVLPVTIEVSVQDSPQAS